MTQTVHCPRCETSWHGNLTDVCDLGHPAEPLRHPGLFFNPVRPPYGNDPLRTPGGTLEEEGE